MRLLVVGGLLALGAACVIEGDGAAENSACQGWIRAMGDCLVAAGQDPTASNDVCNAYPGQDQYFLCMQHAYEMDDCGTAEGLNVVIAETAACESVLEGGESDEGTSK